MSNDRQKNQAGILRALGLVGQLGFAIAAPIVLGVFGGDWLDQRLGGHGLILTGCVLAGVAGGVLAAYGILAKEVGWKR